LAAHLADYTSELGFPSFRFDMPGVGDSEGDLPAEVLEYYELVQNGGHVAFVSDLKAALVQKYGLNGMIYLGHCGSATTGVYAAVQHPSADLLGLILLDPSFIWYRASGQGAQQMKKSSSLSFKEKLISLRLSLRAWLIQKPGGEYLTLLYSQLELLCHRILGRKRVPLDCNRKLLECYRILLSRNIPILVLTAPHVQKHFSQFDYADYLQSNYGRNSLTVVKIAGASHSFLEGNGRQAVSSAVDAWLSAHFRA
jgi:pimeloyl-ACP methyl ester carboxylesterase